MPAFFGFIATSIGSAFAWLGVKVAAKFGIQMALAAVYVSSALVFYAAIVGAGSALVSTMPAVISSVVNYLPSAISPCVSAILAGETAAYVYRQVVIIASIKSRI